MFNWFWKFLYSISKALFEVIDGIMSIANKLCGIETIKIGGQDTDLLTYLITSDQITYAFYAASLCALVILAVFGVFAILKAVSSQKNMTPAQVFVKVIKTMFMFLMVPACMAVLIMCLNTMMRILYDATSYGASTMGDFLFQAFLPDGVEVRGTVDYHVTSSVSAFLDSAGCDLSDYKFFFSWLCCIPILFALAKSILLFVDRVIAIVILYIVSPFSMSATVVDDGAHFKLWRDQILIKFLTGYGTIIGLNIYILIVSLICKNDVMFFDSSFLNFLTKIAFILGGAVSLERIMALIGNLIQAGAGSNEMRDAAIAGQNMKSVGRAVGGIAKGIAKAPVSMINAGNSVSKLGAKETFKKALGIKTDNEFKREGWAGTKEEQEQASQKEEQKQSSLASKIGDAVSSAILGKKQDDSSSSNSNKEKNVASGGAGNNLLNNALSGSSSIKK